MFRRTYLGLFAFALMCAGFVGISTVGCSDGRISGGVSEETNTVAGILVDGSGKAVAGVPVCAMHFTVDSIVFNDTTDSDGKFGFPLMKRGQYGVSARRDSMSYYESVDFEGSEIEIAAKLQKTGVVEGNFHLRLDTVSAGIKIGIPGSPWLTETDEDGSFELKNVPLGVQPLLAKSPDPIHFQDAIYVVSVGKKSSKFRGPIPTGLFEIFASKATESESEPSHSTDTSKSAGEPFNGNDSSLVGALPTTSSDEIVRDADVVASKSLQFPLSPEFGLRSWWSMDFLSEVAKDTKKVGDARGWTEGILLYGVDSLENGPSQKALALYGADEFGVIENDRGILDSATALTFEAWIYLSKLKSGEYRKNIVGKLGFGSPEDKDVFSIAVLDGECGREDISLGFFIADGSSSGFECSDAVFSTYENFDKWVYVTAVWDGKTSSLYINGNLASQKKVSVERIGVSSEPIFFGKESMDIKLDDVRLSTTAITASDVLYRYYLKGGAI
ncbi:LamG-like jellyroll fold domain-containing protein [uncultured Fibrobacter sp.]|uniref:LamG-like jellyroll fold domain-containing protein n=1 Tax=uncultured Fibrobacter sp. TaxID=261512 RepID=UPI0025EE8317|nr:LamG-like jellyroll fold domain-containing protein [uncultured Fibrobacter sp.]